MKKRVLHVLSNINYSGAEIMLYEASSLFIENNLELIALSTDKEVGNFAGELQEAGYKIAHIPFRKSFNFFFEFYKLIKKEKIEILHLHTEKAYFWYAIIGKIAGVKSIVRTLHSIFQFKGILKARRFFQRYVLRELLGVKFLAIGDSVCEVEEKTYRNKSEIIYNWINSEKFSPLGKTEDKNQIRKSLGLKATDLIVLSVGSCNEIKNHKAILYALSKIEPPLRKNLLYVHIGNGPINQQEQILAEELKITDIVFFAGQQFNIRDWLVASDIFIMPSTLEGLGNALMEAMSCGLPSVAYNVYGIKDLIDDNKNGFLVDSNSEALSEGLKKLIVNKSLREKFGQNARQKIISKFNMGNSVSQLLKSYQN